MSALAGARGLVLALLVLLAPAGALAAPKFPPLTGRVVDNAKVLSDATEQKLTGELADLEAKTGHQVVVATVPDLQGYEIEEYGYQLGRTWGIGRKGEDDGAILLVAPKERKVRIEVGYGLEGVLTDALSNVILQQAVLPQFREGRLEQGVVQGTEAIVQQLSLPEDEAKAKVAQAQARPERQSSGGGIPIGGIITIIFIFWIIGAVLRGFGGRGRRGRYGRRGGGGNMWWLLPLILSQSSGRRGGGGWSGGGGGGFGGFSGGGGSFGGGGSSGSW